MSFNGSGTFVVNSAGQPVVTGTTITSTAFNLLTADLATGLSTTLTKDGQSTPTANIPMGSFKLTGLANGTAAADAVRMSQLQSNGANYITVAGTADVITGGVTPALTAYAAGNEFVFVVGSTNTTNVTLNVDGLGAKAITKDGTGALTAGDLTAGDVALVVYDGTRFQLVSASYGVSSWAGGTTGLTPASATTGAVSLAGTLVVANGGTGGTTSTGTGAVVLATNPELVGYTVNTASGVDGEWTTAGLTVYNNGVTPQHDGVLHVMSGTAGVVTATAIGDDVVIEGSGATGISILSPDASYGGIYFGSPSDNDFAYLDAQYASGSPDVSLSTNRAGGFIRLNTGAATLAMKLDASGQITMPLQPSFLATKASGDQSNCTGAGTLAAVTFTSEIFDRNGDYASNTFTAPVTGIYQLGTQVWLAGLTSAMTQGTLRITTSNRVYYSRFNPAASMSVGGTLAVQLHVLADMDAADTATVSVTIENGAGNTADIDGGATDGYTFFYGKLAA